jgi:hypothetical protein
MGYKKHDWSKYGYSRQGNILKIEVYDESEKRIDFFFSNNDKRHREIGKILREKYGINLSPEISKEDSVNNKKELEKEKDWLNPNFGL